MNTQHCIDVCNSLLRGERSAVETYDQVLEKFRSEPSVIPLQRIREEHVAAVSILEENVRSMGGVPDLGTGAWGTFANTVQGAANLMGEGSAIESLQAGENSGKNGYQNALDDDSVMPECKEMIRNRLLPATEEHISTLERIQKTV